MLRQLFQHSANWLLNLTSCPLRNHTTHLQKLKRADSQMVGQNSARNFSAHDNIMAHWGALYHLTALDFSPFAGTTRHNLLLALLSQYACCQMSILTVRIVQRV